MVRDVYGRERERKMGSGRVYRMCIGQERVEFEKPGRVKDHTHSDTTYLCTSYLPIQGRTLWEGQERHRVDLGCVS